MGNSTTSNPMVLDTDATIWTGKTKWIREIQWVDDAGDVADDDTVVMVINDATVTLKYQMEADISSISVWRAGPFNPGIPVSHFQVSTKPTHGVILVWLS